MICEVTTFLLPFALCLSHCLWSFVWWEHILSSCFYDVAIFVVRGLEEGALSYPFPSLGIFRISSDHTAEYQSMYLLTVDAVSGG